jgi:DNA-binding transcriptional regulator YiaG
MPRPVADPKLVEALEEIRQADNALRKGEADRDELSAARLRAVRRGVEAGVSKQAIASTLGVSRQYVGQMVGNETETSA